MCLIIPAERESRAGVDSWEAIILVLGFANPKTVIAYKKVDRGLKLGRVR